MDVATAKMLTISKNSTQVWHISKNLIQCGIMMATTQILVIIGSGIGLLPDNTELSHPRKIATIPVRTLGKNQNNRNWTETLFSK